MAKFQISESGKVYELSMYAGNVDITNDVIHAITCEQGEMCTRLDADDAFEHGFDYHIKGMNFEYLVEMFAEFSDENKTERTAMNLTRIAAAHNVRVNSMLSQELYELAIDNGIAMFDGKDCQTYHFEHVVFIPQKIADECFAEWKRFSDSKNYRYIDSNAFSMMLEKWYHKAMCHVSNSGK